MYFIGHVTQSISNDSLAECRITMDFLHNFFRPLDLEVIFNSQTLFIKAFSKEFILVNNAISIYDIAFEHLLYYKIAPPILCVKLTQTCTFSPQNIVILPTLIQRCHAPL